MRKPVGIGTQGDSFIPRAVPGRAPGGHGQFILLDHPFTHIANPRDLANAAGLGAIFGVPTFLWVAGDGNAPTIGSALAVTGTPAVATTPYQFANEAAVAAEEYDGAEYRNTATVSDPTIGQDIVCYALVRKPFLVAGTDAIISTRTAGAGWGLNFSAANANLYVDDGVGNQTQSAAISLSSLCLLIGIVDGDGNMYLVANGTATAGAATPAAAALGSGDGIGLSADPGGANPIGNGGQVIFCGYQYGAGIADSWIADSFAKAKDLTYRFTGIKPQQGVNGSFARASAACWEDHNGVHRIASSGLPRAGDSGGLRAAPARTNKCYNTINPQLTNGWSVTGGTHDVVDDSTQLAADDLECFGPNVHRFVPGAGDQVIYGGAATANVNAHSVSVVMRGNAGGESVDIGVRDASTGVVTNLGTQVLTTSFVRYIIDGFTPGDTDEQFCLDCDAGDTIYFIAPQLEEGATATTPIPNWATAAAATRAAEVLTTSHTPQDAQGSHSCDITPMGWDSVPSVSKVLSRSAIGANLLYAHNDGWRFTDGTTSIGVYGVTADGVERTVRVRWLPSGESIDVDGSVDADSYDGALQGSGTLIGNTDVEVAIKNLKAYRNGDG